MVFSFLAILAAAVIEGLLALWLAPTPHPKGRDAPPVHRAVRREVHSPLCSSNMAGQLCDCAPDVVVECPVCGQLPRTAAECPNAE